jgi:multiple sugar transport system substrate-binding protein
MRGNYAFSDVRVRNVFQFWKYLIDRQYFVRKQRLWKWDEAMPFLYHKIAGMTLMGNFFAGQLPEIIKQDFGFFRFPVIDDLVPVYEEAPLDLFMVPYYTKNSEAATKFLHEVSKVQFQQEFAESQGMISPNLNSRSSQDYFIRAGAKVLNEAAGLSQFFDRDTSGAMASAALPALTEFMSHGNIERVIENLEVARQRHLMQ